MSPHAKLTSIYQDGNHKRVSKVKYIQTKCFYIYTMMLEIISIAKWLRQFCSNNIKCSVST